MSGFRVLLLSMLVLGLVLASCQPVQAPTPTATPAPAPAATPTPEPAPAISFVPVKQSDEITSQALAGNLLGDPATRGISVLLPPTYASSTKRYPVVYVLHGYTGSEFYSWQFTLDLERLWHDGAIQEMVLVFPNANNALEGSMYLSSPTIGDYETYLTSELVAYIDANYRTLPARESRGIAGCSMGGDGAIHLAFKYPDVYGAVAGISGAYDWTTDPLLEQGTLGFKAVPQTLQEFDAMAWSTKYQIALAAAVAPNPDKPPLYLDMPYEIVDGKAQVAPSFLERLAKCSPMHDVETYLQQPTRIDAIMLYSGEYDANWAVSSRAFAAHLTEQGVDHVFLEVPSGDCPSDNKPVLQFMSDNLAPEGP